MTLSSPHGSDLVGNILLVSPSDLISPHPILPSGIAMARRLWHRGSQCWRHRRSLPWRSAVSRDGSIGCWAINKYGSVVENDEHNLTFWGCNRIRMGRVHGLCLNMLELSLIFSHSMTMTLWPFEYREHYEHPVDLGLPHFQTNA